MRVEIVGPGCPRCQKTEANVRAALKELGLEAGVVKVKDIVSMARKGVMVTPAVLVDGIVKCQGKVPSVLEAKPWFAR